MSKSDSPAVIAVDGGNSKTDVAILASDGRLIGAHRAGPATYHAIGLGRSMSILKGAIEAALSVGGHAAPALGPAAVGAFCLAGADMPLDERRLARALAGMSFAARIMVRNDAIAGLIAGTSEGWGVALVCGAGVNCAAVDQAGRTVRFPALGALSGDRGGGADLGLAALGAAVRARDGRGRRTSLARAVPDAFGLRGPLAVVTAIHAGRLREESLVDLAPVVFEQAVAGDVVARELVDGLADEMVLFARSAIRRLRLSRSPVEVVLVGSIWKTSDVAFHRRVRDGILAVAPNAILRRLEGPPVVGAALLGLAALGSDPTDALDHTAAERARAEITAWDAATS
jgi:N-acetylglucosamine kinase-like BadF-type ATPase